MALIKKIKYFMLKLACTKLGTVSGSGFANATLSNGRKDGVRVLVILPSSSDNMFTFKNSDVKEAAPCGLNKYRVSLHDGKSFVISYDPNHSKDIEEVLF